jgi:hypothetical protein
MVSVLFSPEQVRELRYSFLQNIWVKKKRPSLCHVSRGAIQDPAGRVLQTT